MPKKQGRPAKRTTPKVDPNTDTTSYPIRKTAEIAKSYNGGKEKAIRWARMADPDNDGKELFDFMVKGMSTPDPDPDNQ